MHLQENTFFDLDHVNKVRQNVALYPLNHLQNLKFLHPPVSEITK